MNIYVLDQATEKPAEKNPTSPIFWRVFKANMAILILVLLFTFLPQANPFLANLSKNISTDTVQIYFQLFLGAVVLVATVSFDYLRQVLLSSLAYWKSEKGIGMDEFLAIRTLNQFSEAVKFKAWRSPQVVFAMLALLVSSGGGIGTRLAIELSTGGSCTESDTLISQSRGIIPNETSFGSSCATCVSIRTQFMISKANGFTVSGTCTASRIVKDNITVGYLNAPSGDLRDDMEISVDNVRFVTAKLACSEISPPTTVVGDLTSPESGKTTLVFAELGGATLTNAEDSNFGFIPNLSAIAGADPNEVSSYPFYFFGRAPGVSRSTINLKNECRLTQNFVTANLVYDSNTAVWTVRGDLTYQKSNYVTFYDFRNDTEFDFDEKDPRRVARQNEIYETVFQGALLSSIQSIAMTPNYISTYRRCYSSSDWHQDFCDGSKYPYPEYVPFEVFKARIQQRIDFGLCAITTTPMKKEASMQTVCSRFPAVQARKSACYAIAALLLLLLVFFWSLAFAARHQKLREQDDAALVAAFASWSVVKALENVSIDHANIGMGKQIRFSNFRFIVEKEQGLSLNRDSNQTIL